MTDRVEGEPRRDSSRTEEWIRFQRSLERPRTASSRLEETAANSSRNAGRSPATGLEAESRRLQQAIIQRISQGLLGQERSSLPNASVTSRNETQTLAQLQRSLSSASQQNSAAHPQRAQAAAAQTATAQAAGKNPLGRIYTVKKSGTRAEGMVLSKGLRPGGGAEASKGAPPSPSVSSASKGPAAAPAASSKKSIPQNSSPGPSKAMSQGAVAAASASSPSVVSFSKSKVLSSGVAVFVGQGARAVASAAGLPGAVRSLSPQVQLLSPQAQAHILQLKIPPNLKAFYAQLRPTGLILGLSIARFANRLRFELRLRGAPRRRDRYFLRKIWRRWLRRRRLHSLNKKHVRRVTSNIGRAVGKTKTADLKQYY